MGPIRRGLILLPLLMAPSAGMAQVCEQQRPGWDGAPVSAFGELVFLMQTPIVLALILATALAFRLRNQWVGLVVVVGWSTITYFMNSGTTNADAITEGCIGSPTLFIGMVFALCVGIVLYTAPLPKRGE